MTEVQRTLDGGNGLTILFYHHNDQEINGGIDDIKIRSSNGEVSNILITEAVSGGEHSFCLENGAIREIDLGNEISTLSGIYDLSRIDVVAACSGMLNQQDQQQLSSTVEKEVLGLQLLAAGAGIGVSDHRIYFPQFEDFGDASGILTGQANSRIAVLPMDKAKDTAVEDKLEFQDKDLFSSHISTELLSICGLWLTQQGNALEKILQHPTGDGDHSIQLVRSFVRTATSSLHELGAVVDSFFVGNLPVPQGNLPAPNPYYLAETTAEGVHHRNFRLRPEREFEISKNISGPELIKMILGRMVRDLLQIHKIFKHGLQSRMKADIDVVAQEMIGKNAWLQVINAGDDSSQSLTQDQIDETINSINQLVDKPENAAVFGDEWTQALELSVGIVDGSDEAERIRQAAGNPKWVSVEIDSLAPEFSSDLTNMAESLGVSESQESSSVQQTQNDSQRNLLKMTTQRFQKEATQAHLRFSRLITRLQELKEPKEENQKLSSAMIKGLFAGSFFIIAFSLLVFSPLHNLFPEGIGAVWRLRLFVIVSCPVLLSIAFLFGPRETEQRQVYKILSFAILVAGSLLVMLFPKFSISNSTKWVGSAIALALIVLLVLKVFNLFKSEESTQILEDGPALRVCKIILPIYIFLVSVFALNNDYYRPADLDNGTWLAVTLTLGVALLLSSGFYVSLTRQRAENTFNTWKAQFLWLAEEAKEAAYELRLVENYRTQWLGTALVLARLFHFPHGLPIDQRILDDSKSSHPSEAQKLQIISLTPTAVGIQSFKENANRKISEPGWLLKQYGIMARQFEKNQMGMSADTHQITTVKPETDPYPVPLNLALSGAASGRRWPFCYKVYEGDYDNLLRFSAVQKLTAALLETYLEQPNSYVTSRGPDSGDDLSKAFAELLVQDQQFWVPAIFGIDTAVQFQGSQKFSTNVWWPSDLLGKPDAEEAEWKTVNSASTSSTETSIFAQVIRVDISEISSLSSFQKLP